MTLLRAPAALMVLSLAVILIGNLVGSPAPAPADSRAAEDRQEPEQVNNEDCAICHEDLTRAFDKNPHALLEKSPRYRLENSCESCHGPGREHVDGGGDTEKIISFKGDDAELYNSQCLDCHRDDHELTGFGAGSHAKQGLSCSECHGIHQSALVTRLLKAPTNSLCLSCHVQARTDFSKPYHHRVKENAVTCNDCHQPHSDLDRGHRRSTLAGRASCFSCHAEKEGPFAFEHASLRIRDCQACHEPHGSNNPKMLVRSTVRGLCLECHSASANVLTAQPPAFHDLRSPRYQNCTTCHVMIHGSNASPFFLR